MRWWFLTPQSINSSDHQNKRSKLLLCATSSGFGYEKIQLFHACWISALFMGLNRHFVNQNQELEHVIIICSITKVDIMLWRTNMVIFPAWNLVPRRNRFKASLNIFNPQELVTLLMVVREKTWILLKLFWRSHTVLGSKNPFSRQVLIALKW